MSTTSHSFRHSDSAGVATPRFKSRPSQESNEQNLTQVLDQIRNEIRSAVKQSGLTVVRSRFDTSDIVQESMLQIWKRLRAEEMDNVEFTRGLLAVIAKGHAYKQLRFHLAGKRSVKRERGRAKPQLSEDSSPLESADIREQIGLMLDALNYVHPVRQLIIFRRFFDDASYQQIATEVMRTKEWVRQQCLKAQKEIRTLLMHRS